MSPLSNDPETQAGLKTRRQVLGDAYVDAALGKVTPFTAPLQELVEAMGMFQLGKQRGLVVA